VNKHLKGRANDERERIKVGKVNNGQDDPKDGFYARMLVLGRRGGNDDVH